jgi:hypothetical protein
VQPLFLSLASLLKSGKGGSEFPFEKGQKGDGGESKGAAATNEMVEFRSDCDMSMGKGARCTAHGARPVSQGKEIGAESKDHGVNGPRLR